MWASSLSDCNRVIIHLFPIFLKANVQRRQTAFLSLFSFCWSLSLLCTIEGGRGKQTFVLLPPPPQYLHLTFHFWFLCVCCFRYTQKGKRPDFASLGGTLCYESVQWSWPKFLQVFLVSQGGTLNVPLVSTYPNEVGPNPCYSTWDSAIYTGLWKRIQLHPFVFPWGFSRLSSTANILTTASALKCCFNIKMSVVMCGDVWWCPR